MSETPKVTPFPSNHFLWLYNPNVVPSENVNSAYSGPSAESGPNDFIAAPGADDLQVGRRCEQQRIAVRGALHGGIRKRDRDGDGDAERDREHGDKRSERFAADASDNERLENHTGVVRLSAASAPEIGSRTVSRPSPPFEFRVGLRMQRARLDVFDDDRITPTTGTATSMPPNPNASPPTNTAKMTARLRLSIIISKLGDVRLSGYSFIISPAERLVP